MALGVVRGTTFARRLAASGVVRGTTFALCWCRGTNEPCIVHKLLVTCYACYLSFIILRWTIEETGQTQLVQV